MRIKDKNVNKYFMGFKKCLVKMLKEQRYQTYEMHGKGNQDIWAKTLTSNGFAIKKV
jgi:hypothetical protein